MAKKVGLTFNLKDHKDHRKLNHRDLVRSGGVAMISSFILIIILNILFDKLGIVNTVIDTYIFWRLVFGSFVFFLIGFFDDIFNLSPLTRIIIQIAISSLFWFWGFKIDHIYLYTTANESNVILIPKLISLAVTIIWIVGLTNAINWMDGLDGLAAGIACISSLSLLIISLFFNNFNAALSAITLAGISIGFLRFNLYPAKILMGDGGSYFLGFNIAILSILSCTRIVEGNIELYPHLFLIILLVPILDMGKVIFLRLKDGFSPFYPDRRHLHHILIDNKISPRKTLNIILSLSIVNSFISLISLKLIV